jgi:hypothetical protein
LRQSTRHGYWFIDYPQQEGSATLTKLGCGESDARLIAAAPNLYEALELMLAMPEFDGTKETSETRRTAKWAARLALAAARPKPEEERT